jgi:hypothetical protein
VRAVNTAEATYASSCGGGGFAQTIADLALAPPGGAPFISPDLVTGQKSGYVIAVGAGVGGNVVLASAMTCNSASADSNTSFYVHAEPITVGSTGQRSFASSNTGAIFQLASGGVIPNTMAGAIALQ